MTLKITNTLSGELEAFSPRNPDKVTMYVCGPTVYNYSHIGNARPAVVFDVLYRLLQKKFPTVVYARNYTDVDDKINATAREESVTIDVVTRRYIAAYKKDMAAIGVLDPNFEPRVTENVSAITIMIAKLIRDGFAYSAEGHVLFEVGKFSAYGLLSGRAREDMIAGSRVEIAPYKKDPADFVLWKPSKPDEPGWSSEWGYGRPGWHIECSAMIKELFGPSIDIHGGGSDLIFPHHENEIAQGTCVNNGSVYCSYWMHNGHLTIDGRKMSKSLGNVILIKDLLERIPGEVIRYALLVAHYRQPLDWSETSVSKAKKSLDRLYRVLQFASDVEANFEDLKNNRIEDALLNDLNTADALAEIHRLAKAVRSEDNLVRRQLLKAELLSGARLLGLLQENPNVWFSEKAESEIDLVYVEKCVADRENARQRRDFETADRIRDELIAAGVTLEDDSTGTTWYRQKKV